MRKRDESSYGEEVRRSTCTRGAPYGPLVDEHLCKTSLVHTEIVKIFDCFEVENATPSDNHSL